jgi:serine protease
MRRFGQLLFVLTISCGSAMAAERNPVRSHPVEIGPEAGRLIVGFRATASNTVVQTVNTRRQGQSVKISQARTTAADATGLASRAGLAVTKTRQIAPNMHVLLLQKTLYGADVESALAKLRADPAVKFAEVDRRRYAQWVPNDLLYQPPVDVQTTNTEGRSGQWFMDTPAATAIVNGTTTQDLSATDAVSAWTITTGSTGTVIADIDTGVRFDHPDLLRAGQGGRLLPGYDFVDEDQNPNSPFNGLGTFLIANDGDGWDPDPSDPGDWLSVADFNNVLFPLGTCGDPNDPNNPDGHVDSSWHGTRVAGILGAHSNNSVGVAGMTWLPWILPVRALGKCGGYDSDIIKGMVWAAGVSTAGFPDNPYPADIINLSIGGASPCSADYQDAINTLTAMGVLIVVSAGNGSLPGNPAPVDAPANCLGVLAVAGLRNVGTKVGYSSFGLEVGVSAPAGNCVTASGACLRPIDTTTNAGFTVPAMNGYTDQTNFNLGTSFSAPIVTGIAALMRAVNANLTPDQLITRIKASATPFPPDSTGLPICPNTDATSGECACPNTGDQCGAGMVNALSAVNAALKPIAAVALPATITANSSAMFDASGSAASCPSTPRTIAATSYAWIGTGGVTVPMGANTAQVTVMLGNTPGTLTLTVTDSAGDTDSATVTIDPSLGTAATSAPATAGTSASACPAALAITLAAPTITQAFAPASVGQNVASTLTVTLTNTNAFVLTQSNFTENLPVSVTVSATPVPTTTCTGAGLALTNTTGAVTLTGGNIPANGSCTVTMSVQSATAGSYTNTIAANSLTTGPAGANTVPATATLTVTAPPSKGGGGALSWLYLLFAGGLLLANQRRVWVAAKR